MELPIAPKIEPILDEVVLTKAPLALVVCQVRFETNLAVSEGRTARSIQDALGGKNEYIGVEQITAQQVGVLVGPGGPTATVGSPTVSGWRFTSEDGKWVVSIMPDFAGLETTAYDTWTDSFGSRLRQLLVSVGNIVQPTYEQRLGLRFVNHFSDLKFGSPPDWAAILASTVAGPLLHPVFGSGVTGAQQHLTVTLDPGAGIAASLRHGIAGDVADAAGLGYLLDIDVYRQKARAFDAAEIHDAAYLFRGYANTLFQSSLNDEYLESLR